MLSLVALAALATPMHGEDDFPLVGTFTENQACKTDGSDPGVSRVKITPRDIDSVFGLCTILSKKREGATFVVHVECKGPGGSQMLSDVTSRRARTRPSTFQIRTRPTRPCFIDVLIEGPARPLLLQSLDPWSAPIIGIVHVAFRRARVMTSPATCSLCFSISRKTLRFAGPEHGRASAARLAAIPAGESPVNRGVQTLL